MRLGFQSKSPFELIEHHKFQEEGWRVNVRPKGGMTMYSNTDAHALFGENKRYGVIDASDYVDHPGDIAIFARLHLAIKDEPLTERITLNSVEVSALITALDGTP